MSLFKKDLEQEEILGRFLSEHYQKIKLKFQRIHQMDLQLLGVDLLLEGKNNLTYKVDEKAQLHYLNKDLPTFALEMSYLKAGEMKQGWLFDTNKVTEIYFFIFSIHLFNPLETMNHENDIQSCEVVLVNRIRLLNELSKKGLDFQECTRINDLLRAEKVKTRIVFAEGFNFQISNQIEEKPVNLIVRKKFLESIGKKYVFKRINLQLV